MCVWGGWTKESKLLSKLKKPRSQLGCSGKTCQLSYVSMYAPKGAGSALESVLKAHEAQAHRSSELKEASVSYFSQWTPFGGKGPQELQPSAIPKDFRMLSVPFLWQQVVLNRAMSSWEDNTQKVRYQFPEAKTRQEPTVLLQDNNPFTKLRKNQAFLKTSFKNAKWQWSWSYMTCNNACLSQEKRVEERHPWSKQTGCSREVQNILPTQLAKI